MREVAESDGCKNAIPRAGGEVNVSAVLRGTIEPSWCKVGGVLGVRVLYRWTSNLVVGTPCWSRSLPPSTSWSWLGSVKLRWMRWMSGGAEGDGFGGVTSESLTSFREAPLNSMLNVIH